MTIRLDDDLALARTLAAHADLISMRRFTAQDFTVTTKPDRTPVTEADRAAELIILAALARFAPGVPVIADGDTGYGGLLNMRHTVQGYEQAGAAAIQIEDQEFPKKCGHTPNRRVIPMEDMVRKIRVAVEARASKDFLIIARTDARAVEGFEEALARAEAFIEAGADITFVEAPVSVEELRRIPQALPVPQLVNIVIGGKTPTLDAAEFGRMGFGLVLYANAALQGAVQGMNAALSQLRDTGRLDEDSGLVASFAQRQRLVQKDLLDGIALSYKR